jgi:putative membrane protein
MDLRRIDLRLIDIPRAGTFCRERHPKGIVGSQEPQETIMRLAGTLALMLTFAPLDASMAQSLTDPQIAHIAYTAGVIDIKAAQLALKISKTKSVRAFATDMARDHGAVNQQALALVKKLKVTPQDNATSQALTSQADAKHKELGALKGAAFDKAYAENEVAYHQLVNSTLEKTLIPSASNEELKALLSTGLKLFQGHEQHAEHLVMELK